MSSALILGAALANYGPNAPEAELERAVASQEGVELFKFRPRGPAAAAFDWQAVISTTADLVEIAGALWFVYDRVVKPRIAAGQVNAFLAIGIRRSDGGFTQLNPGREYEDEATFTRDFVTQVTALREGGESIGDAELLWQFSEDETWVHVRKQESAS